MLLYLNYLSKFVHAPWQLPKGVSIVLTHLCAVHGLIAMETLYPSLALTSKVINLMMIYKITMILYLGVIKINIILYITWSTVL